MKLNKFFIAIGLAVTAMSLQSCLKDQEDFFDEDSAERLQAVLENTKAVLTSSENGWIFDYYPDRELSYGGYIYALKFDDKKVTVRCEISSAEAETSLYKLNTNNGPVLSFDSYNSLMHFFATPSNGAYEAMDGDFEFMIMDVTDDLITLRGLRTGNKMYLRRLDEDPETFIKSVGRIYDTNVLSNASGTIGSNTFNCENDIQIHYMEFSWGEGMTAGNYYLSTPTGIRFKEPVEINGATISELAYTFDENTKVGAFSGEDSAGNQISIAGVLPETYAYFEEYLGSFSFVYYNANRAINIEIEGDKKTGSYAINGFNSNYDVAASYNKAMGCLEINSQLLGIEGSTAVWLASWSLSGGGNLSWSSAYGVYALKSPKNPNVFLFEPNSSSFATDSFILWTTNLSGESTGQLSSSSSYLINGSTQVPYLSGLIKK